MHTILGPSHSRHLIWWCRHCPGIDTEAVGHIVRLKALVSPAHQQHGGERSQHLGLLRRAARILDTNGRLSVYRGFIRPMLEYAPLVWMSAAPAHLARLDRIQQKAMAIIGPDVLLQSLAARRTLSGLCYMYKLQWIGSPQQLTNIVPLAAPTVVRPRTRHTHAAAHPHQLLNNLPPAAPEYIRVHQVVLPL